MSVQYVYILLFRGEIELISKELKVVYEDLKSKLATWELKELKSYSQISRDFHNHKDYCFSVTNFSYIRIIKREIIPSYRKYKFIKNIF